MLEGSLDAAHQDPSTFIRFGPSVAHEESTKICADLFFLPNRLTIHHKWVILCFLRPMYNKKNFQQGSIVQDLCQSTGGIPPQKAKVLQISSYSTQTLRLTLCSRGVHNRKWMPPPGQKVTTCQNSSGSRRPQRVSQSPVFSFLGWMENHWK